MPERPHRVVVAAYPGVQILDVTGPVEVFSMANRAGARYSIEVVAAGAGPVSTTSGLDIVAHASLAATRGRIGTLMVAGGNGTEEAIVNGPLVPWVRKAAARADRVTSVCSGAFILAAAGLLDGRRATTHWVACDLLEEVFPAVDVDRDRIYVRDGNVWTSAGVTAGMDLALALVEADHGRDAALEVARNLVLFLTRPGGQSQFSAQLAVQQADREPLRDLQALIAEHPDLDLSVPALAARVSMSTRNFARAFRREVGVTPAEYVERVRVEAAQRMLESTTRGMDDIARACGFGTVETMHRAFKRRARVSPGQYRSHFQPDLKEATA